ncbi:Prohead protease [uncultured Caudovirales phage]|uniref:Prohead protease n=1 Tax=uncultured Caudovirales phage TaxID=2100421 RepID=A0A6J5NPJ9_9CAUD|nr:Prohead protease [uncultured Caudovirales phage]
MNEMLTFSAELTADSAARTISGKIVPFNGEVGNTSAGAVVFERGAINIADSSKVKLLLEHDPKQPIGRAQFFNETEEGIFASFKISKSSRGTDALIEASEELRTGLSVGVMVNAAKPKNGVLYVSSADLLEVSLVQAAAFKSAAVTDIAASEEEAVEETLPTESETVVEDTTVEATPVEAAAVEAARPTVTAMAYTKPRIEITAAKYAENSIRAALGDEDARQYVRAADNTTDNAGLVPTRQLSEIINPLGTTIRPSIEAISRGVLPDAGMTFEIPKITAMPTVAVTAEDAAFSDTDQNSAFLSVDVKKYAGQQTFSVELLDRTSPAFFDELVRNMAAAYAKATDAAVNAALIAGATADATTTVTYPTASELLGIVARGSASVYNATLGLANPFARNMIVNTAQWSNIMTLNDAGRPIYNASQPMNAGGLATPTALQGNVAGLNLYVTPNTAAGTDTDGSIVIVNPDAYTWYESPTYRLRAESTAAGSVTIGYYGFGAIATKVASGAFKNNKQ